MTPFAHRILRDAAERPAGQRFRNNGADRDVPRILLKAHCFDLTAVAEMIPPLGMKMLEIEGGLIEGVKERHLAFLPAPTTWLEYKVPPSGNDPPQWFGYLLEEVKELDMALMTLCVRTGEAMDVVSQTALPTARNDRFEVRYGKPMIEGPSDEDMIHMTLDVYPMLALVNTPRVIGRRQHMPHVGLQRQIARSKGMTGKFPLQAWTEIVLEVTPPRDASGDGVHEARLTGSKALHFCRSHLRIQNGRLVRVQAHWRGDPCLGVKRSRYTLVPPRG